MLFDNRITLYKTMLLKGIEKKIASMEIDVFLNTHTRDNSVHIYSYNLQIGFCSGDGYGFMLKGFESVTTRYHQGIASQILAYAKAGKWDYIYNSVKNSKSLRDLKSYFGYSYNKNYVNFDYK